MDCFKPFAHERLKKIS